MKKLIYLPILFLILFNSCRKDNIPPDGNVTPIMARDSLYAIMKDWYYWYDLLPNVTKENFSDPYSLLEEMRYKPLDHWSFLADYDEFMAEMQGIFVGHGFRIGVDSTGNARIALIYSNSPLYSMGVRRGWIVKKINGVELAPILIAGDGTAYTNLIGPGEAGITNNFLFEKPDGTEITIPSTKSIFSINSVILYDTLHLSSGVTGQLVFESFIAPSENELATAFAFFKANNIKDLILDLRYNPGGYFYISKILASIIVGNSEQGNVFVKFMYNDKHPKEDITYHFLSTPYSLDLPRLAVITSRSTASASETLMNALTPYMDVISIGDTTHGKPTGMNGWDIGKKYFFWPVTFSVKNSLDQGDFFAGIFPAKVISDDITRDFNDREELCLKEAIYYLENGSVSGKGVSEFSRYPQFSERPDWMSNSFVLEK